LLFLRFLVESICGGFIQRFGLGYNWV